MGSAPELVRPLVERFWRAGGAREGRGFLLDGRVLPRLVGEAAIRGGVISLRSRREWQRIFREGSSCRQGGLVVYVLLRAYGGGPRLGLVVSRRVGKSVERNRLRRRLKAAWQSNVGDVAPQVDCVLVARPQAARETFRELSVDLVEGLRSLGGLASPPASP